MARRYELEELNEMLVIWRNILEIQSQGVGRTFKHVKSGEHYIAWNVGFDHETMTIEVEYSPLRMPAVRFHRDAKDFQNKFTMVTQPRT